LLRAPALFVDGGVHLGGDDTLLAHGGKHSALKKIRNIKYYILIIRICCGSLILKAVLRIRDPMPF
jgi:hypothetical protein